MPSVSYRLAFIPTSLSESLMVSSLKNLVKIPLFLCLFNVYIISCYYSFPNGHYIFFCIHNIIVIINLILLIINIIINSTTYLHNNIHCYFDFYCCEVLVFLISSSASSLMTWLYSAISSLQIFSKLLSLEIWSQFDSLLSLFPSWLVS